MGRTHRDTHGLAVAFAQGRLDPGLGLLALQTEARRRRHLDDLRALELQAGVAASCDELLVPHVEHGVELLPVPRRDDVDPVVAESPEHGPDHLPNRVPRPSCLLGGVSGLGDVDLVVDRSRIERQIGRARPDRQRVRLELASPGPDPITDGAVVLRCDLDPRQRNTRQHTVAVDDALGDPAQRERDHDAQRDEAEDSPPRPTRQPPLTTR